jgi:hypothetical protein
VVAVDTYLVDVSRELPRRARPFLPNVLHLLGDLGSVRGVLGEQTAEKLVHGLVSRRGRVETPATLDSLGNVSWHPSTLPHHSVHVRPFAGIHTRLCPGPFV